MGIGNTSSASLWPRFFKNRLNVFVVEPNEQPTIATQTNILKQVIDFHGTINDLWKLCKLGGFEVSNVRSYLQALKTIC